MWVYLWHQTTITPILLHFNPKQPEFPHHKQKPFTNSLSNFLQTTVKQRLNTLLQLTIYHKKYPI